MTQSTVRSPANLAADRKRCKYPGCGAPAAYRNSQRGRPLEYCTDPSHNARTALQAKRRSAAEHGDGESLPALRPVADGAVTVAGLLDRAERLRDELATVLTESTERLTEITAAETVDREIASAERDAAVKITAAQRKQADAEKLVDAMSRRLDRAIELEQLALAAADEAAALAEEARSRAAQQVITATNKLADAEAERDRVRSAAAASLTDKQNEVDAARMAQARSEGERDIAVSRSQTLAEENASLRQQLAEQTRLHRREIESRDLEVGLMKLFACFAVDHMDLEAERTSGEGPEAPVVGRSCGRLSPAGPGRSEHRMDGAGPDRSRECG